MSFEKEAFFIYKLVPEETNNIDLPLTDPFKEFLTVFYDANSSYTLKVNTLSKLWETLLPFAKEKSEQNLNVYLRLICQWSLLIVLDEEWENLNSESKSFLCSSMEVLKCNLNETNEHQKDTLQLLNAITNIKKKPWGVPYLDKIFNNQKITQEDTLAYLKSEQGDCLFERIKILCSSQCEDLALKLVDICFNVASGKLKEFLQEIHFVILFTLKKKADEQVVKELKTLSVDEHVSLVENLINYSKIEKICPKAKPLHNCCQKLVEEGLHILMVKCMIEKCVADNFKYVCKLWIEYVLLKHKDVVEMANACLSIADTASSSAHLYILSEEINVKMIEKENNKALCIEMFIRALLLNVNEMENIKDNKEHKKQSAKCLSDGFLKLATLVHGCVTIVRECLLTAFSLHPKLNTFEDIMKEITSLDDNCKTDIEISSSFCSEGDTIGLTETLCDDMIILLSVQRHSSLSWSLKPHDLKAACQTHISKYEEYFEKKELNFLKIDYTQFDNMPEEEVDMYEGIEKGYEHFLIDEEDEENVQNVKEIVKELRYQSEKTTGADSDYDEKKKISSKDKSNKNDKPKHYSDESKLSSTKKKKRISKKYDDPDWNERGSAVKSSKAKSAGLKMVMLPKKKTVEKIERTSGVKSFTNKALVLPDNKQELQSFIDRLESSPSGSIAAPSYSNSAYKRPCSTSFLNVSKTVATDFGKGRYYSATNPRDYLKSNLSTSFKVNKSKLLYPRYLSKMLEEKMNIDTDDESECTSEIGGFYGDMVDFLNSEEELLDKKLEENLEEVIIKPKNLDHRSIVFDLKLKLTKTDTEPERELEIEEDLSFLFNHIKNLNIS